MTGDGADWGEEPVPDDPADLGEAGLRLWRSVVDQYAFDEHELVLLREAVRTADLLVKLDQLIRADGPLIDSPQGRKAHPAAVEARQQRIALARLMAALRLPSGDEGDQQAGARPQRRSGVRTPYGIRGAV